ncbi:MAG TPA: ATP-binding protein, partial [Alphaproteobacteria bacterium]|nr:ATP-binding protein [Alphaproteobacteria bacterium]
MIQDKLRAYLKRILITPAPFKGLGRLWALCIINTTLIILLGGMVILLSDNFTILFLTLTMVISAATIVILLLVKIQKLKFTTQKQRIESKAYEVIQTPLLILTPDLHFCYGNKKAREVCWWAESIPLLKKILSSPESRIALENLIESFYQSEKNAVTLYLRGEKGEEVWHIQSIPLGDQALWHCSNVTQEKSEESKSIAQLKTLTLFLDHAAEGLFSLNEKGIILFCNEKFAKWLGYTRAEIVGASLSKFIVKSRNQNPLKLSEMQGKCDFITASSRIKSAFLEQTQIPTGGGFITHSLLNLYTHFANQSDMSKILEMTPLPVICLDENAQIQDSNILFREKFWLESTSIRGASFLNLVSDFQREEVKNALHNYIHGKDEGVLLDIHFNDARESIASTFFACLPVKNQKGCFLVLHDITEQKRFESQLIQSQKMQAVGQLAGGIAHDFNNLLTAMIGFCDLMLLRHTPGDQSFTDVMQIKQNANRAANLVRQLLAFSRQQTLQPKVLNITDCLAELSALLQRLIGSNIQLKMKHARELGLVLVDQGQFEQVIINLVVNARDAMEGSGTISLITQNCELKKAKRFGPDVIPAGSYVRVEITDTGMGIKPEIIDRIFDPFFSTKEVGSGTGLGLSTVYGTVKQTGGFVHVESKVGVGTTFSVFLPKCTSEFTALPPAEKQEKIALPDLTGSSTILLVEDEDAVRVFSGRALRSKGYHVIEAINGAEALELIKLGRDKIDLVISDVVMPLMDGPTFVNEISQMKVTPKVLFISGYTEDTFHNRIKDDAQIQFLAKPFSLNELAVKVKEILDDSAPTLKNA